ncbi:MAG TPA: hypothetical protein VF808_03730 [Ktedonobacterales bacterium]
MKMLIFYSSADQLPRDTLVLAGSAIGAVIIGVPALRRSAIAA